MDALVWEAPRVMTMRQKDEPAPAPGEVKIAVAYVGICGSDLGGYLGHNALRKPPLVMGHEFSGTIVALGAGVTGLATGQKVTCNPLLYCGVCRFCRSGLRHLCVSRTLVGAHRPGAFAEFVCVPENTVVPLRDAMDLRSGAMVEPIAVGVRIGRLAGELAGETGLVIGAGPIGLLAVQALAAKGAAKVFVSDLDPARLAMAGKLGAATVDPAADDLVEVVRKATGGLGAAVTVDAVGSAKTRAQAVAATRSAGKVLLSGLHEEAGMFPGSEVIRREIEVKGAFSYAPDDFDAGLVAARDRTMRLDPWIVEAPLAEGGDWFARLADRPGNVSKVLLIP
jgi:threonine dehydrogenase-like Zn-dependent dehydrogenase